MEALSGRDWHSIATDETLQLLETDRQRGLEAAEAKKRLERFGPNRITGKKSKSLLLRFLLQFHQPLVYILIASGIITALLREWVDSSVIFGVVLVNAIIGFLQESKAVYAIEALARIMTAEATVLREGCKLRISALEVVPGDIVLLQSGDKVPADMRLLTVKDLRIDESLLTGESLPAEKTVESVEQSAILNDRRNMAYASTLVTYGQGAGAVTATGNGTEVGCISEMISSADELDTPFTRKIARFSKVLLFVILGLAIITFIIGMLRGVTAIQMLLASVALAVGAIPEALPAAVTITLAIGVSRMARRKAIIRRLPAVETLGGATVICSDKTGTLTENQMTVQKIISGGESYETTGSGYSPEGSLAAVSGSTGNDFSAALQETLRAGLLCNDSELLQEGARWKTQGDPTEGALVVSALKGRLSMEDERKRMPRIDAVPFESQHQFMATLHEAGNGKPRVAYVKGAVEKVLERCSYMLDANGQAVQLDKEAMLKKAEKPATEGQRILAFARKEFAPDKAAISDSDFASGLTLLGLQAMMDPPRNAAVAAVENCKTAGIKIKMITGDHALTASAIAKKIGLIDGSGKDGITVSGNDIDKASDQELIELAGRATVFARVTPAQKLRLVEALQARGEVVAMTGDGVNDAPALKRADIGIAMGAGGTDVAREAADMVLTDDDFASIEAAVEEGRGVFDNLTKFVVWTLPTNLGEGLVILAAIFAGTALPILPLQILWINMTTAVLLGLMLAFEPKEEDIMNRPPRDPYMPILTWELVERIVVVGILLLIGAFGLFEWELRNGASETVARAVAVNAFVMVQIFYLFNCRSLSRRSAQFNLFSNIQLFAGVFIMAVLQMLYTYLPSMNRLFNSAPISLNAWVRIIILGVIAYFAVEIEKLSRVKHKIKSQLLQRSGKKSDENLSAISVFPAAKNSH